jgi:hypothetical protein
LSTGCRSSTPTSLRGSASRRGDRPRQADRCRCPPFHRQHGPVHGLQKDPFLFLFDGGKPVSTFGGGPSARLCRLARTAKKVFLGRRRKRCVTAERKWRHLDVNRLRKTRPVGRPDFPSGTVTEASSGPCQGTLGGTGRQAPCPAPIITRSSFTDFRDSPAVHGHGRRAAGPAWSSCRTPRPAGPHHFFRAQGSSPASPQAFGRSVRHFC